MFSRFSEPRWLVGSGALLLAGGYAAMDSGAVHGRPAFAAARAAFYFGLVLLTVGVAVWLRQPPRPDPAETGDDDEPPLPDG